MAEALARTAGQLRGDAEYLDDLAFAESGQLDVERLAGLPAAIRTRVLRDAAVLAGCPPGALAAGHIGQVDALVTAWRGQRWTDLPGGVRARRQAGKGVVQQDRPQRWRTRRGVIRWTNVTWVPS